MRYLPGQLWKILLKNEDARTLLLVLKSEELDGQNIVHVGFVGGSEDLPEHMPFSEDAVNRSVLALEGELPALPSFQDGYKRWRDAYDAGDAGIYSLTVQEVLNLQ